MNRNAPKCRNAYEAFYFFSCFGICKFDAKVKKMYNVLKLGILKI